MADQPHCDTDGAVDLEACPRWPRWCACERCSVCGFPKHTAIHGPLYGQPPGSKPYGHKFATIDEGR